MFGDEKQEVQSSLPWWSNRWASSWRDVAGTYASRAGGHSSMSSQVSSLDQLDTSILEREDGDVGARLPHSLCPLRERVGMVMPRNLD